ITKPELDYTNTKPHVLNISDILFDIYSVMTCFCKKILRGERAMQSFSQADGRFCSFPDVMIIKMNPIQFLPFSHLPPSVGSAQPARGPQWAVKGGVRGGGMEPYEGSAPAFHFNSGGPRYLEAT
ncbi:hypothetical protein Tco_0695713, partial [Tanacetum coccineum]